MALKMIEDAEAKGLIKEGGQLLKEHLVIQEWD